MSRRLLALAASALLMTQEPVQAAPTLKPPTRIDGGGGAVAYLVESHELPLVDMSISFRSGSSVEPDSKLGMTRLFARMLRRGAAGRTSDDIEAAIDRLGGEV